MPTPRVQDGDRRRCRTACGNCKRRKERCDGTQPCGRCSERLVQLQCQYDDRVHRRMDRRGSRPMRATESGSETSSSDLWMRPDASLEPDSAPVAGDRLNSTGLVSEPLEKQQQSSPRPSQQLFPDGRGNLIFFGKSAELSLLHDVRELAGGILGSCPFVDRPLEFPLLEIPASTQQTGPNASTLDPLRRPCKSEARVFVDWAMRLTSRLLGAVDEDDVQRSMSSWIDQDTGDDETDATNFLILAVGAQARPGDHDSTAEAFFHYGRHLTMTRLAERPSLASVRCHLWITFYLDCASMKTAASEAVGSAARAAFALGIHREDISSFFDNTEAAARERLWRALRKLDLYTNTCLGRPTCTVETRVARAPNAYSSTSALSLINEAVLACLHTGSGISDALILAISEQYRLWTDRIHEGLRTDGIRSTEHLGDSDTIALANVKGAYYWFIMLLTRDHLLREAAAQVSPDNTVRGSPRPDAVIVHACVDSAVRAMDLLEKVLHMQGAPKRLPFVVILAFGTCLVLGLATFADLDHLFPLEKGLRVGLGLLRKFQDQDDLARCFVGIIEDLQDARDRFVEQRARRRMESRGPLVSQLVGRIPEASPASASQTGEEPSSRSEKTLLDWPMCTSRSPTGMWLSMDHQPLTPGSLDIGSTFADLLPSVFGQMMDNVGGTSGVATQDPAYFY